MKSNRREFVKNLGAGAVGLTLASPVALSSCTTTESKREVQVATVQVKRNKQMWPIKSGLKSKRIKFDVPQNQISWAFMKELREHNKTRKIHPVNP
jgi:hypothetical protein